MCVEDLYTFGKLNFFPVCVCARARVCVFACVCVWGGLFIRDYWQGSLEESTHLPSERKQRTNLQASPDVVLFYND